MACGADWSEFGEGASGYESYESSSASERSLGLQIPSQAADYEAAAQDRDTAKDHINGEALTSGQAAIK